MGEKYLCHPANHVTRLAKPLADVNVKRHMQKDAPAVIIIGERKRAHV